MNTETLTEKKYEYPLTKEEYEELAAKYYSDDADDDGELEPIFNKDGTPTVATLMAFYESEHGLTEEVTLDELQEWIASLE